MKRLDAILALVCALGGIVTYGVLAILISAGVR